MITSAPTTYRHTIEELATELPVLRPMFKRERNARGELEERLTGYGQVNARGEIEPLPDKAC